MCHTPRTQPSKSGFHFSLYVQYTKSTSCPNLICAIHQELSRPKVASIWVYMCSILRVHSDLIRSVHQEPIHQKVASIWAYICCVLRVISNSVWCTHLQKYFYVQYTKNQALINWFPFELIFAVYLEYIVSSHFDYSYPIILTLYVQYTKKPAVKKWLSFDLICRCVSDRTHFWYGRTRGLLKYCTPIVTL